MKPVLGHWERLGRLLKPDPSLSWLATWTGAACSRRLGESSSVDLLVTGRDRQNRSVIGRVRIDMRQPMNLVQVEKTPVLEPGTLGAFDENGVSYPCWVTSGRKSYLYYTGWMPTVLTPFQNHLGLAEEGADGSLQRVSRAPIMDRNPDDYLSIGSVFVLEEEGLWHMWYTAFLSWGQTSKDPKHRYLIKYAHSRDGLHWIRPNRVCIPLNSGEMAVARPSVLKLGNSYHMWYCYRGESYRIGYAHSTDGLSWTRMDHLAGISGSPGAWDSDEQCYPHVFQFEDHLYMLYCGNQYGREGLGLCRLKL